MREKIFQAIQKALNGHQRLRITFKPNSAKRVFSVIAMYRNSAISLNNGDAHILQSIMDSHNWGKHSRTFTVTPNYKFDEESFIDHMQDALEKIEVVS